MSFQRSDFIVKRRFVTLLGLGRAACEGSTTFQSLSPLRSTTNGLSAAAIRARLMSVSSKAGNIDLSRRSASVFPRSASTLASTSITGPCP